MFFLQCCLQIPNFKASESWVSRLLRAGSFASRRRTAVVTEKTRLSRAQAIPLAQSSVESFRIRAAFYDPSRIFNADQSDVQKELVKTRVPARKGQKRLEVTVKNTENLTHSFTLLPQLYMDGRVGPKTLMVIAEKNAVFPPTLQPPSAPNVMVLPGKNHIMGLWHLEQWSKEVLGGDATPDNCLAVLDSWPS